jgi:hypothetical protein
MLFFLSSRHKLRFYDPSKAYLAILLIHVVGVLVVSFSVILVPFYAEYFRDVFDDVP